MEKDVMNTEINDQAVSTVEEVSNISLGKAGIVAGAVVTLVAAGYGIYKLIKIFRNKKSVEEEIVETVVVSEEDEVNDNKKNKRK